MTGQQGSQTNDYGIITSEITEGIADSLEVTLNGTTVLSGAIGFPNGTFPGVSGFDGLGLFGPDGSVFVDGLLGFLSAAGTTAEGTNTLEFFIGDDDDVVVDSALLVDNITLDGVVIEGFETDTPGESPAPGTTIGAVTVQASGNFSTIPESTSMALLLGIGLEVSAATRRRMGTPRDEVR